MHDEVQVVILAAGMGTRLGRPHPKSLTRLKNGSTILGQQLGNVRAVFGERTEILIVVGFKMEQIMEAAPDVSFAYNEAYDQTNTSKSLVKALRCTGSRGVLWMNGDVVFQPEVFHQVKPLIERGQSFVCVNTSSVGKEEVKYTVGDGGTIVQLAKTIPVEDAAGEAVGINYVAAADKDALIARLDEVDDQDYFERGLELAIERDGMQVVPVDITELFAMEIDFEEDLQRANKEL